MLSQGEGCREDVARGGGDGSNHVKGTINHQLQKCTAVYTTWANICDPSREKGAYPNFTLWLFSRSWPWNEEKILECEWNFSNTPWTRHENSHGHREIFHAVKKVIVISRPEIYISRREKGHSLCEIFHGVEKIYSLRFTWTSLFYRECCCIIKSRLPTEAHFSDLLLQALKLESHYHSKSIQSVPKIRCWRLHRRLLLRFSA